MTADLELQKKRLLELAERCYRKGCYEQSEFLTAAEQDMLLRTMKSMSHIPFTLDGGHPSCERRVALFGSEQLCGYEACADLRCILIAPKNDRFSDELTHRDFLGSLLALGIRRDTLGDIFIIGHSGYLFCLDTVAEFIIRNLDRIKHTTVVCSLLDTIPDELTPRSETLSVNVASERADAVIGAVFGFSRTESARHFAAQRVFIDSLVVEDGSRPLKPGQTVSVRGFGRFIYLSEPRETKKGRLFVKVERFI